ncbi:hypothetical protein [uncultured Devosia sp.]|uniref:hypothetical protein n=1 Tax=uncultured Devosia sp. TaxID=211434 RepID=UPI0035C9ECE1
MNTYLKSVSVATVVGLGIFASAGSAFAAGCLTPDQSFYSIADDSDLAKDGSTAANTKGFSCEVVASDYSVRQPEVKVNSTVKATAPQENTTFSLTDD